MLLTRSLETDVRQTRPFPWSKMSLIVNLAINSHSLEVRNTCILVIISVCFALRASNITGQYAISFSDFNFCNSGKLLSLTLRKSKSGRKIIPYFDEAFADLNIHIFMADLQKFSNMPLHEALGVTGSNIRVLLSPFTQHSLRVTAARRLISLGFNDAQLTALGGWSSVELGRYYALADE